jgi:hypothetical protein
MVSLQFTHEKHYLKYKYIFTYKKEASEQKDEMSTCKIY